MKPVSRRCFVEFTPAFFTCFVRYINLDFLIFTGADGTIRREEALISHDIAFSFRIRMLVLGHKYNTLQFFDFVKILIRKNIRPY